jgi:hypothetical protein
MKANPGGHVSPENVMGRDPLITRLWSTLEQLGIVLVAERRMGKSSIINKMKAEPQQGALVLLSDVEGVSRPLEFVERLLWDIDKHLSTGEKTAGWLKQLWSALGGVEIGGILRLPQSAAPDWKTLVERILGDLAQNQKRRRVILIWDELPWMLQKIGRVAGQPVVVDLLDVLRSQRQRYSNLRMVYTGSIGLHHVVSGLQEEGYASSPVNDMRIIEVPPLDHPDATELARNLLLGEGLASDRSDESALMIAGLVDGVPYYIHHVVASLADRGRPVTPELAADVVAKALADAQDPWNLDHYRRRLRQYYGERAGLVRGLLDQLADKSPLDLGELHDRLKVGLQPDSDVARRIVEGDRENLLTLVRLLQRDHYLRQEDNGRYAFRFDLIRRWWRLGLS